MDSPIPYFGGKSRLAQTIINRIPVHKTYAEVFGCAAWILFRKPLSSLETLNDLDRHLINFYLVTKYHAEALADELATLQPGREIFLQLRAELDRPLMTDIQRAAAYYYVQRHGFSARPRQPSFCTRPHRPVQCRAAVFRRVLPLVAERLRGVLLENLTWEKFIALYDSPRTFFFIDPPYMGHTEYRHNFKADDFDRLAAALRGLSGRFLLTHTDQPEIRALFNGRKFKIETVALDYSASIRAKGDKSRQGHEVLITNY